MADPPTGVTPKETDVVGVGSDTIEFLFDQFSFDYNKTHTGAHLYSWDATNPKTGAMGDNIVTKSGCSATPRPDGSSAGITALDANTKTSGRQALLHRLREVVAASRVHRSSIRPWRNRVHLFGQGRRHLGE
jgi:hypothetical protein